MSAPTWKSQYMHLMRSLATGELTGKELAENARWRLWQY